MSKYLIKTTEEHRADSEREAAELIEAAKKDGRYFDLHQLSMLRSEFFEKVHDK